MRRLLALLSALILALMLICIQSLAAASSTDKTVGIDIGFEDITDLYYTYIRRKSP